jgi:UDP-glucose 4-epimerase
VTIAVTGADGFIGTRVCALLERQERAPVRVVRRADGPGADRRIVPDLADAAALDAALRGVRAVIHLAARAHVLRETERDALAAYERVNVQGTLAVAAAAARAGARRLVFVSSIGVNGVETHGRPFTESDEPAPRQPYAASKHRVELALRDFASHHALEVVIVRPPLVYGPGAKGNFRVLLELARRAWPLPLASVANRRSLVGVGNLAGFLLLCADHAAAAGELFLVAEPEVHSTPRLVRDIAAVLQRPDRLFPCSVSWLAAAARALGREALFTKVCGSLEVSADKARRLLGWRPAIAYADGLREAVEEFRGRRAAA